MRNAAHLIECLVQHDGPAYGYSDLVLHKVRKGAFMLISPLVQKWAMLEEFCGKVLEGEAGQVAAVFAHKVLVEPVGLFDLKANTLDRRELLLGDIDYETTGELRGGGRREGVNDAPFVRRIGGRDSGGEQGTLIGRLGFRQRLLWREPCAWRANERIIVLG